MIDFAYTATDRDRTIFHDKQIAHRIESDGARKVKLAAVAGPLSPLKPLRPSPATVVMTPVV